MIQNVMLTSLTPLKNINEINCWENRPFTTIWPENIQRKTKDITRTIKKKQKRVRTAFSTEQLRALERAYNRHKYVDSQKRAELAKFLNIGDKCIKIWFQNRRMKEKKESSEYSCDSSSESISNDTPSVSASPPLQITPNPVSPPIQITPDHLPTEHQNKFSLYHNSENAYQLPTYYNTNQMSSDYGNMQVPNFANYFYNDNNVYPTQYYPFEVNYSNNGCNEFNQFGSEMNNCWASNYPYYSQI